MSISWTPEHVARLKELWDSGLSASQCGAKLGFSRNAVISKVHRSGFASREAKKQSVRSVTTRRKRGTVQARIAQQPRAVNMNEIGAVNAVLALRGHSCRWPVGNPFEADFHFCGEATRKTYCPQHHALAYVKRERATK